MGPVVFFGEVKGEDSYPFISHKLLMGSKALQKEKLFPVTSQLQSLFICGSVSKKTVARLCPEQ